MPIRQFEMYHGAVITRLLRSERPVSLRLIETQPTESWSTYTLNDTVDLFITYSRSPREVNRSGGGTSWQFTLSRNQLRQINPEHRGRPVYLALVCANRTLEKDGARICLLTPEEVASLVDFDRDQHCITVRKPRSRGQLRVFKNWKEEILVPGSRLDNWEVPGG